MSDSLIQSVAIVASKTNPVSLRVATLNIDTNLVRAITGFGLLTHPEWSFENRLPLIIDCFEKTNADVWFIQETRQCKATNRITNTEIEVLCF
jgi:hypothetical protein